MWEAITTDIEKLLAVPGFLTEHNVNRDSTHMRKQVQKPIIKRILHLQTTKYTFSRCMSKHNSCTIVWHRIDLCCFGRLSAMKEITNGFMVQESKSLTESPAKKAEGSYPTTPKPKDRETRFSHCCLSFFW